MNKLREKWYLGDSRYEKVLEQMQLLAIHDVTTMRQHKNGTVTWKLPIKNADSKLCIEVASFKSGYVRNQGVSCHSNYQLNKRCESEPDYYKIERNGETLYRKYTTRTCKLIPIEIDRLEYLISYCLKNYYIKHANFVADGEYVAKWYHEHQLAGQKNCAVRFRDKSDCGHYDRIRDLEEKLDNMTEARDYYKDKLEESDYRIKDLERMLDGYKGRETNHDQELEKAHDQIKKLDDFIEASKTFADSMYEGRDDRVKELENKLQSIIRTARH